jgi:hypothetical protein
MYRTRKHLCCQNFCIAHLVVLSLVLGNISFAYPLNGHQPERHKPQEWRKVGKVERERLSNIAEDISETFIVIFETPPDTPRGSRHITVNNVTNNESDEMVGILWTKSHVIEEISKRDVKIRTKEKRGSKVKDLPRPDHNFFDKIIDAKSRNKTNIFVNQNMAKDKVSKKIILAKSNASEEKENSTNGVFEMIKRRNNKSADNIRRTGQTPGETTNTHAKFRWGTWGKGFVNIAMQSFGGGRGKKLDFVFRIFYFFYFQLLDLLDNQI